MIKQNKKGKKQEKCDKAILQSRRVCKKKDLISSDDRSHPSKDLAFLSLSRMEMGNRAHIYIYIYPPKKLQNKTERENKIKTDSHVILKTNQSNHLIT